MSIQSLLFEKILEKYPRKAQAIETLEELLSVGKDAVYRRLRGDTFLTPDQMELLAKHFKISIDQLTLEDNTAILVSFNAFEQPAQNFHEFVSNIYNQINIQYIIHQRNKHNLYYLFLDILN